MRDHAYYLNQICLGTRLRDLRRRRNVTQATLAKALGFAHPSTISSIEKGRRSVSDDELKCIAQVLRCSKDSLLKAYVQKLKI